MAAILSDAVTLFVVCVVGWLVYRAGRAVERAAQDSARQDAVSVLAFITSERDALVKRCARLQRQLDVVSTAVTDSDRGGRARVLKAVS